MDSLKILSGTGWAIEMFLWPMEETSLCLFHFSRLFLVMKKDYFCCCFASFLRGAYFISSGWVYSQQVPPKFCEVLFSIVWSGLDGRDDWNPHGIHEGGLLWSSSNIGYDRFFFGIWELDNLKYCLFIGENDEKSEAFLFCICGDIGVMSKSIFLGKAFASWRDSSQKWMLWFTVIWSESVVLLF